MYLLPAETQHCYFKAWSKQQKFFFADSFTLLKPQGAFCFEIRLCVIYPQNSVPDNPTHE